MQEDKLMAFRYEPGKGKKKYPVSKRDGEEKAHMRKRYKNGKWVTMFDKDY